MKASSETDNHVSLRSPVIAVAGLDLVRTVLRIERCRRDNSVHQEFLGLATDHAADTGASAARVARVTYVTILRRLFETAPPARLVLVFIGFAVRNDLSRPEGFGTW